MQLSKSSIISLCLVLLYASPLQAQDTPTETPPVQEAPTTEPAQINEDTPSVEADSEEKNDVEETDEDEDEDEVVEDLDEDEDLEDLEDLDSLMDEVEEDQDTDTDVNEPLDFKTIEVSYTPEDIAKTGGSAQLIDEEDLEKFEYDDVHDVLNKAAGVYVRQEDGFGLRPNIGIRGANSERSKKITLMEDGVLFGPAPYSAPAAYYFPLMQRINGVEVFKGPGAILYGPHTIGGAINFTTRDINYGHQGSATLAGGMFPSGKLHAWHAYGAKRYGVLGEAIHLRTGGFKDLDGGGNTGFARTEAMLKAHVNSDPNARVFHKLEIKGIFSQETSHETYLGLTDADFDANPYRRYKASSLDEMNLWRAAVNVQHSVEFGENLDLRSVVYRHDMSRAWNKFNTFSDGTAAAEVLANPDSSRNGVFYRILTGEEDSAPNNTSLIIGNNSRTFFSQGLQSTLRHRHETSTWSNKVEAGARLHQDQIQRNHSEALYNMENGELVRTSDAETFPTRNTDTTTALAVWALDQVSFWKLTMTPGVRYEHIMTSHEDRNDPSAEEVKGTQSILIPGAGAYLEVVKNAGILAGVHRGFSPVTPGQSGNTTPETSVNYEGGARFDNLKNSRVEAIGFFNDYKNMLGQCTFAAGCQEQDLDNQFNAGRAWIYGAEVLGAHTFALGSPNRTLTFDVSYTYTHTELLTSFISNNPQLAEVTPGDELPYVPKHQGAASISYADQKLAANIGAAYVSSMREVASQGDEGARTDAYLTLDALVRYHVMPMFAVYTRGDNLLNAQPIASRRPYGARPISPRYLELGIELDWGNKAKE